jgi:cyclic pyranopterin phosphate synthase
MRRLHLPVLDGNAVVAGGEISGDPLVDPFARRVRYLRISVTDRCNYRCTYCMPESLTDQLVFEPRVQVLTFEEITRLVRVFAALGVRKVRLTGGEPTVRKGIVELVQQVANVGGIEQVVMTTNGHLLDELAAPLREAGLSAVNVSIDSLDPDKFARLTSRGDLARVVRGIDAARAAGLRIKTNTVALAGGEGNTDEIVALCRFAWERGATPRFIEHMPMSGGALYQPEAELSAAAIRALVEAALGPLVPARPSNPDAGPARYWALASTPVREVGIISAMTEHFCDDCNRLRLTATGALHACLGHDDAVSLRDVMRRGGTDEDVTRAIASAVTGKRAGHEFVRTGDGGPQKHMISIGG